MLGLRWVEPYLGRDRTRTRPIEANRLVLASNQYKGVWGTFSGYVLSIVTNLSSTGLGSLRSGKTGTINLT